MRKYNWKPDLPDHRDLLYMKVAQPVHALPAHVDLRPHCSPVENQGDIGSCSGHAIAGALEFIEKKENLPFHRVSRLFVYYNERVIEGDPGQDGGAMLRDGMKAIATYGACNEVLWPYEDALLTKKPVEAAYEDGSKHKVSQYSRLNNLGDIRHCLAEGYPVVFGISVFESFESEEVAKTGHIPMPGQTEAMIGGHAILAVGYDDAKQVIIFRNSWGTEWGDKGYGYLPYSYMTSGLADDFWTVRR